MSSILSEIDGDLLSITLNRPQKKNALGDKEWTALSGLIGRAADSAEIDFLLLTGVGDVFCAGVDLALNREATAQAGGLEAQTERIGGVVQALENLPQLVIICLNGPAVGIGMHMALAGDLVLADRKAVLWVPEASLGLPDVQHLAYLTERLGRHKALSMILMGRRLDAKEALAEGLIGECYGDGDSLQAGAETYLSQLRAVPRTVRRTVKSALLDGGLKGNLDLQLKAVAELKPDE